MKPKYKYSVRECLLDLIDWLCEESELVLSDIQHKTTEIVPRADGTNGGYGAGYASTGGDGAGYYYDDKQNRLVKAEPNYHAMLKQKR